MYDMPASEELSTQDLLRLLRKTREAIVRIDELLKELDELGPRAPAALGLSVEYALKLRERLEGDLVALETALAAARTRKLAGRGDII